MWEDGDGSSDFFYVKPCDSINYECIENISPFLPIFCTFFMEGKLRMPLLCRKCHQKEWFSAKHKPAAKGILLKRTKKSGI